MALGQYLLIALALLPGLAGAAGHSPVVLKRNAGDTLDMRIIPPVPAVPSLYAWDTGTASASINTTQQEALY